MLQPHQTERLEQGELGCPWQSCSRGFLRSYKTTEGIPKAASYKPRFGKPLRLIILMDLTPSVPKEQALLT